MMKTHTLRTVATALLAVGLAALAVGCTSRYRLDLFMTLNEEKQKVDVQSVDAFPNSVLGDAYAPKKVVDGDGNVVVLLVGGTGETIKGTVNSVMTIDRGMDCRLFFELPKPLSPKTFDLEDKSVLQILGYYEIPERDKIYTVEAGTLAIDSISGKNLFATCSATYVNHEGQRVVYDGQFKANVKPIIELGN